MTCRRASEVLSKKSGAPLHDGPRLFVVPSAVRLCQTNVHMTTSLLALCANKHQNNNIYVRYDCVGIESIYAWHTSSSGGLKHRNEGRAIAALPVGGGTI